ncbi:MAG: hypothetical protein J7639_22780 [Paenibacillaceae bacterium]|nr:hypothetical protein [Paenibacillaceae bacterium]
MNRILSPIEQVELVAKLADLKDQHYRSLLMIGVLTELLVEKGICSKDELEAKAAMLDSLSLPPAHPIS